MVDISKSIITLVDMNKSRIILVDMTFFVIHIGPEPFHQLAVGRMTVVFSIIE